MISRLPSLFVFLGAFAVILAAALAYVFWRTHAAFDLSLAARRRLAGGFCFFWLAFLLVLPLSRALPRGAAYGLDWAVYPWLGALLIALVAFVVADGVGLVLRAVHAVAPMDAQRRVLLQRALGIAALGSTGVLSAVALQKGTQTPCVVSQTIRLTKLPPELDGLRIVQISDLHIGPMRGGAWLTDVVAQVNALQADMVVLTGDLADGSVEELAPHVAPLADIHAPLGAYFVTGNHEYYSGVEAWCAHVARLGFRVLRNERVTIARQESEASFELAGVDDFHAARFAGQGADLPKALAGRDAESLLILLAHQPAAVAEAAHHRVDLQLSGHTHGGQMWPFSYLVRMQQPYVKGLHDHGGTQIYVNSGTGFWGPPMRLGTQAEITEITLRS